MFTKDACSRRRKKVLEGVSRWEIEYSVARARHLIAERERAIWSRSMYVYMSMRHEV